MPKLALCVKSSQVPQVISRVREAREQALIVDPEVLKEVLLLQTGLFDRVFAETDPTYLQLIPYIVLSNPAGYIFNYSRGSGSEEARLGGKMSVGLGGHVDYAPEKNETLQQLLMREASRELHEEAGITVDPYQLTILGLLVNATTEVDQVHLGVLCSYVLPEGTVISPEANVIEKGMFSPIEDLIEPAMMRRMENWSHMALQLYIPKSQRA